MNMTEASMRRQLSLALRWAARLELHEGTCNHFSCTLPDMPGYYLINPFGLHFSEVRPSDLLLLDDAGNVVAGEGSVEITAFNIHSSLHRALPRAVCVLHTHMPYATALTATATERLEPCHQNALRFIDRTAYDDAHGGYGGLALDVSEGDRMAGAMENADILFLRSHGVIVAGPSVARAFDDLYYLERAAKIQVLAMSTGRELAQVGGNAARQAAAEFAAQADLYADTHFAALERIMDREAPGWDD